MSIRIGGSGVDVSNDELVVALITFFAVLIVLTIIAYVLYTVARNSDNKKTLNYCTVKVLEKYSSQGSVAWYVVEKQNGERMRLRNLKENKLIISQGDFGIIAYQGKTIIDFERQ